ncbi:MAG: hypothetical protein N2037_13305 [Acidimicrobiales bacterium]|nr:hypothetical protein [Acidimicrobiales bacterium]
MQVAAVALVVALGTGGFAGLGSTSAWRRSSYDASYSLLSAHDLKVSLAAGTTASADALLAATTSMIHPDWIEAASVRLSLPTQVGASQADEAILVPGRLIGVTV